MITEHSIVQIRATRFSAGVEEDICVLHPSGHFLFHVPGDPWHNWQDSVSISEGVVTFNRLVYLFKLCVVGQSHSGPYPGWVASELEECGAEETFRHCGFAFQGATDFMLSDRKLNGINNVTFCGVIETVGDPDHEAGLVTISAFKGVLNLLGTADIMTACTPVPSAFQVNP